MYIDVLRWTVIPVYWTTPSINLLPAYRPSRGGSNAAYCSLVDMRCRDFIHCSRAVSL